MTVTDHRFTETDPVPLDDDGEGIAVCDLDGRSDDHHHELVEYGFAEEGRDNPDEEAEAADGPPWGPDPLPDYDDRAEWLAPKVITHGPVLRDDDWPDQAEVDFAMDYGRAMSFADEAAETARAMQAHAANHGAGRR